MFHVSANIHVTSCHVTPMTMVINCNKEVCSKLFSVVVSRVELYEVIHQLIDSKSLCLIQTSFNVFFSNVTYDELFDQTIVLFLRTLYGNPLTFK